MDTSWRVLIVLISGALIGGVTLLVGSPPRGEAVSLLPPPTPAPLLVHVEGAVAEPGVYTLPPGSRVQNAIDAAGGPLKEAVLSGLNLAAELSDGDKLLVPDQDSYIPPAAPAAAPSSGGGEQAVSYPIDINTATLEELDSLPGIGPVKAQAIIDYRQQNGPFTIIDQIQNVSGIGPVTFEKIKEYITINSD
ncbi:helix-hairpin-helix domain-containing protein [Chloroflexota bacterium]